MKKNKPWKCQDSQGDLLRKLIITTAFCSCDDSTFSLRKEKFGYRFTKDASGNISNNLLFMDDLKSYGRNKEELERLLEIICLFKGYWYGVQAR